MILTSGQPSAAVSLPRAYFITFSCYGARLHGDASGSVDRNHNQFETPYLPPNTKRVQSHRKRMNQPPYELDRRRRDFVLKAMQEVCSYRGWVLLAAHMRTNHVHVVVEALASPERVMNDFKGLASRKLNEQGIDTPHRQRWARHGSTRYLWKPEQVDAAIHYVVYGQGEPMAVFVKK
ncbi:MAG: transposase [Acidobacteria bacterium]|nr:transposase [Acidobacteriota bacterium]MBI3658217.1 transposase [Acidobacteriota bacterium]